MTAEKLAQIEAAKAALPKTTPGPWMVRRDDCHFYSATEISNGHRIIAETNMEWDSPIIAAAPVLVERVIELEAELAALKEWQGKALIILKKERQREIVWHAMNGTTEQEQSPVAALIAQAQGGERSAPAPEVCADRDK